MIASRNTRCAPAIVRHAVCGAVLLTPATLRAQEPVVADTTTAPTHGAPTAPAPATISTVTVTDTTPMGPDLSGEPKHFRWGGHLGVGAFFPGTAPAAALAVRAGVQHRHLGFYGELGLTGGAGGTLDTGDDHAAGASVLYLGHIAPMIELELQPAFVAVGVLVGVGAWSRSSSTSTAQESTSERVITTGAPAGFIPGLDARVGWRFGDEHHRLTLALDAKALFSEVAVAAGTSSFDGVVGSQRTEPGWTIVPSITIGYDLL